MSRATSQSQTMRGTLNKVEAVEILAAEQIASVPAHLYEAVVQSIPFARPIFGR